MKFWKKYHKWVGLLFAVFILNFCFSGIIMNHRRFFSKCELDRSWMPGDYKYNNWNNGIIRGTERLNDGSILAYGNAGIWKTDSCITVSRPFNYGLDEGIDNRKISDIVTLPDGSIWCAGLWDIYRISADGRNWLKQILPDNEERVTDIASKGDTIVAMTRSYIYESIPPYTEFKKHEIKAPEGYDGKIGLFRQVWLLHSGELFGKAGKLIVDALALVLIFLCITGIIYTVAPKCIKRRKRKEKSTKSAVKTMKFSTKWHIKTGKWLFVPTLILAVTGMCLRPPMMIPFVMTSSKPIPGTTLDSDNPWHDKLRAIRWDKNLERWLISTSEGFFNLEDIGSIPEAFDVEPPISPMGINVFHPYGGDKVSGQWNGTWLIGSFSGIYRWNPSTGEIIDHITDERYDPSKKSFFGASSVAGYSEDLLEDKEILFDYNFGARTAESESNLLPLMPEHMTDQPISLWNFALELHVGRCYYPLLGPLSSMFVFISGILLTLTLVSGYVLRPGKKKKVKKSKEN